jgi:hypothetical protein
MQHRLSMRSSLTTLAAATVLVGGASIAGYAATSHSGGSGGAATSSSLITYKFGHAGSPFSVAQHFVKIPAPVGTYQITMSGIWTSSTNTDDLACLVVDKNAFAGSDLSLIYALEQESLDTSDNANIISQTAYAHFTKGQKLVVGCTTEGDTGPVTLAQPLEINFKKVTQTITKGTPIQISKSGLNRLASR